MTRLKLKSTDIKQYRENSIEAQNGICPLCEGELQDSVQDHDHKSGHCRDVLCRSCNALEGKIINAINRFAKGGNAEVFLENLVKYWSVDFSENPLHPTHKTELYKEIRATNKKIKLAKMPSTVSRLKESRKELKAQIVYFDLVA
ncbi:MAG: hypothetical protein ACJAS1_005147 [Oleiphilaceae bacterium]|jgi:hypothetical protein